MPPVLYQQSYARAPADTVLVTGSERKEILVHQIVLFCATPFFERLFHYDAMSSAPAPDHSMDIDSVPHPGSQPQQNEGTAARRMYFPDVSPSIMMQIVKYCYSGVVDLNMDNVVELHRVADMFVIERIVHACQSFLQSQTSGARGTLMSPSSTSSCPSSPSSGSQASATKRRWNPRTG